MAISYLKFLPVNKSLELCLPENRAAAMELLAADTRSRCFRVSVEGYDTSLPVYEIKEALIKSFHMQCGDHVYDIVLDIDPMTNLAKRHAFLYLQGGEDKGRLALALNRTDAGGWIAIVKAAPVPRESESLLDVEEAIKLRTLYYQKNHSTPLWVEGYDIRLPEDEVKNALIKHFCPCGAMADLCIYQDPLSETLTRMAFMYFYGEEKLQKALALNGTNVGGWTVTVKHLPLPCSGPFYYGCEPNDPRNLIY